MISRESLKMSYKSVWWSTLIKNKVQHIFLHNVWPQTHSFIILMTQLLGFSAIFEVPWQLVHPSEETNCI